MAGPPPVLSLILCSRNDAYLGNSRWRLETALNYAGAQVAALGRPGAVEVIVADWGSDVPLRDVVAVDPAAARIVSFVTVPPEVARARQGDSPFAEVLALNAAARRARGTFIGRIDQDTLVGGRFLRQFLAWVETGSPIEAPLDAALWFANRRSIPYRFAVRCPSFPAVARYVAWFGRWLRIESARTFYRSDVGIWLLHRDLWDASGGYDERMIYMNDMEIDMATRLMSRYPMIDLGRLVGHDFYHLDHYHPRESRSSSTHRTVNAQRPPEPRGLRPSGADWGLPDCAFEVATAVPPRPTSPSRAALVGVPIELAVAAWTGARTTVDRAVYRFIPTSRHRWARRARTAWQAVWGLPVTRWPAVLRRLWAERPSAKAESS
jgi:hypothetical protein